MLNPQYIILLGAPGAGKGTQAKLLQEQIGLTHISSGDLFRKNISTPDAARRARQIVYGHAASLCQTMSRCGW